MAEPRAEVRNAADPQQVKRAARKEQRREDQRLAIYKAVLATSDGRAVFWDLLESAGLWKTVSNPHGGRQSELIGRRDFGLELTAMLIRADEDGYLRMETEARARARAEARETDAAHTAAATPQGDA